MPLKVQLESYTLRVRRKYVAKEDQEDEMLGSIGATEHLDFYDFLTDFEDQSTRYCLDRTGQSLMRVSEFEAGGRQIHGQADAGSWGLTAELQDFETGDVAYTRTDRDAEVMRHFFLVDAPADTTRGILILQRLGGRGIKRHFCLALTKAFADWTENAFLLEVHRQVPGSVIDQLQRHGRIRKIELLTYEMPNELSEYERHIRGDSPEWEETRGTIRVEVSAKREKRFPWQPWMRSVMTGERTFHEIRENLEIPNDGQIKLEVDIGGKTRTIDLADPRNISPYIDITEDVEVVEGQPDMEDVHAAAIDLLASLIREVRAREP